MKSKRGLDQFAASTGVPRLMVRWRDCLKRSGRLPLSFNLDHPGKPFYAQLRRAELRASMSIAEKATGHDSQEAREVVEACRRKGLTGLRRARQRPFGGATNLVASLIAGRTNGAPRARYAEMEDGPVFQGQLGWSGGFALRREMAGGARVRGWLHA